jgi:hypothetical protein
MVYLVALRPLAAALAAKLLLVPPLRQIPEVAEVAQAVTLQQTLAVTVVLVL